MKKVSLILFVTFVTAMGLTFLVLDHASRDMPAPSLDLPPLAPDSGIAHVANPPHQHAASNVATINIPSIHLRYRITMDVDAGPAFWPITGRPGGGDTIAIAGHRTTHTHPFYYLDRLERGDSIYVRYQNRSYRYLVTGMQVYSITNLHIADAVGYERLLLSACSNPDRSPTSAQYRLVVYALPA